MKIRTILIIFFTIFLIIKFDQGVFNKPGIAKFLDPFNGFWQNAKKSSIDFGLKKIKSNKIKDDIIIKFDNNLLPFAEVKNKEDYYFIQGYISAFHRLWQMEFQTLACEGRLSEIFGYKEKALLYDINQRKKCLKIAAKKLLKKINSNPETKKYLKAYVNGVNTFIESLNQKCYPVEYKILNYKPEKWTALKTCLVMILFIDTLSGKDAAQAYTNVYNRFGEKFSEFLYPDFPKDIEPIVKQKNWDNINNRSPKLNKLNVPKNIPQIKLPNKLNNGLAGSNSWVISKSKSASNNVILADDPHLSIHLPSIIYFMSIKINDSQVMGFVLPGMPTFGIGTNNDVCWGITNCLINTRDVFLLNFSDDSFSEYKYNDKYIKAQHIVEEIKIRGKKSKFIKIINTHYGPLYYDKNISKNKGYAIKSQSFYPSNFLLSMDKMNFAKSIDEFYEGIKLMDTPALNFSCGSKKGNIGIFISGKFPIRYEKQGRYIMDGNNPKNDWNKFIPKDYNPKIINPKIGFVKSANEHTTFKEYPFYLPGPFYRYFRNRIITKNLSNLIDKKKKININDVQMLQLNTFNLGASEFLPFLIENLNQDNFSQKYIDYIDKLTKWNFHDDPLLVEPTIYRIWFKNISKSIYKKLFANLNYCKLPSIFRSIQILKNKKNRKYLQDILGENIIDIINKSFLITIKEISEWEKKHNSEYLFFKYRKISLPHIIPLFTSFGHDNLVVGGSRDTVNSNENGNNVALRVIFEMKNKGTDIWFIYPGGQSGNPGNPKYDQFVNKWVEGKYLKINNHIQNQISQINIKPK